METLYEPGSTWLELHAYPDAEGVSVYFHDVSERKLAEAERERQLLRGQTLLRVVRGFAAEGDPQRLVGTIAEEAMRLLGGDRVIVARWDAQREVLTPISTTEAAEEDEAAAAVDSSIGLAVQRRRPVVVHHPPPPAGGEQSAATAGVRAEVAAPLLEEGRLLGAISVTSRDDARRFGLEDADLLEVLAGLAAATLVGHEEARLEGVLLSARTAQHEVNNRLALVRGYGRDLAGEPLGSGHSTQAREGGRRPRSRVGTGPPPDHRSGRHARLTRPADALKAGTLTGHQRATYHARWQLARRLPSTEERRLGTTMLGEPRAESPPVRRATL